MGTNKIAVVGAVLLLLIVGVVVFNKMNQPSATAPAKTSSDGAFNPNVDAAKKDVKPISKTADGDTVVDSLKGVNAQFKKTHDDYSEIKDAYKELADKVSRMEMQAKQQKQVANTIPALPTGTDSTHTSTDELVSGVLNQFEEGQKDLKDMVSQFAPKTKKSNRSNATAASDSNAYTAVEPSPMALNGYEVTDDELGISNSNTTNLFADKSKTFQSAERAHLPGYVTVKPITQSVSSGSMLDKSKRVLSKTGTAINNGLVDTSDQIKNTLAETESTNTNGLPGLKRASNSTQHYTIPVRATLINGVSMTALIGTVPVGGKVNDPFPVKIIIGDDNLATNGLRIPGLRGIVFEGLARGNWNLSCVSVALTGATFTFDDGRIQYLGHEKNQGNDSIKQSEAESPFGGEGGGSNNAIGYISNPQGVPCIPGRRVTDADKQLFTMGVFGAAKSYFDAKALAETSTNNSVFGSQSAVTGDKTKFVNNKTYSDSIATIMDFYNKRMRDTFDAIVADPATPVSLHITKELKIDYNPSNRKLSYSSGEDHANSMD